MIKQAAYMGVAEPSRDLIEWIVGLFGQFLINHVLIVAPTEAAQKAWISKILLGSTAGEVTYKVLGNASNKPPAEDIHFTDGEFMPDYFEAGALVYDIIIFDSGEADHEYTPADAYSPTGRAILSKSTKIKPRVYEGMDAFGPLNDALPAEWG